VSVPATYAWFAAHEFRLAWRDWLSMLTAGKRGRVGALAIGLGVFVVFMHVIALIAISQFAGVGANPSKTTLAILSAFVLLAWCICGPTDRHAANHFASNEVYVGAPCGNYER
jgi:ABC-2 type transport system permease protein